MKTIKAIIAGGVILVLFCAFIYGCFLVARTFNYHFFYKDKVKETIAEMVKPEALK